MAVTIALLLLTAVRNGLRRDYQVVDYAARTIQAEKRGIIADYTLQTLMYFQDSR